MFKWLKLANFPSELPKEGLYTFINPYSYMQSRDSRGLFSRFDGVMLDGQLAVSYFSFLKVGDYRRQSFDFSSLAGPVFQTCVSEGRCIFFVGSKPDEVSAAVVKIQAKYPGLRIGGFRNGYFSGAAERLEFIDTLVRQGPKVVVVGMGTPLQEQFLVDLWDAGWRGLGFTCGGFLHQTSKSGVQYYPNWVNRFNLRWAYRIYDEPSLFVRYLRHYPRFIFFALLDRCS